MSKAISVKNLWVVYRSLKSVSSKRALFTFGKNKLDVFEAVKDVSFDIEEGQVVGLIGRNGSGKSTLLRAIAGIFSADKGDINLYGKTVSLISIGVGFKTNLSGRENIFLSGLLMGFKKSEIQEKYPRRKGCKPEHIPCRPQYTQRTHSKQKCRIEHIPADRESEGNIVSCIYHSYPEAEQIA